MNTEGPAPGGPCLVLASRGSVALGHRTGVRVNGPALGSLHLKAPRPLQAQEQHPGMWTHRFKRGKVSVLLGVMGTRVPSLSFQCSFFAEWPPAIPAAMATTKQCRAPSRSQKLNRTMQVEDSQICGVAPDRAHRSLIGNNRKL